MHVPKDQRSKLDDKAKKCIFVRYGDEEYCYRLWDPLKKTMVRSRDVAFHEHETMEDRKQTQAPHRAMDSVLVPTLESVIDGIDPNEAEPRDEEEPTTIVEGADKPDT